MAVDWNAGPFLRKLPGMLEEWARREIAAIQRERRCAGEEAVREFLRRHPNPAAGRAAGTGRARVYSG
jgi:hypothetical protein